MSDIVKMVTQKTFNEMKFIVDNWVNDDNFTKTGTSKALAQNFQKILEGFSSDNPQVIVEGITQLGQLTKNTYNLK